ncbi:DUF4142 domain-containing protein [Ideonella sp. DXS29W]|uniref:DUF4142 domain-containing protein n=1 Tax=Ideonella lacteola TaxID=2984193 RepID=A0ABU9BID4_9BURK
MFMIVRSLKALLCLAVCCLSLSVGVLAQATGPEPGAQPLSNADQVAMRQAIGELRVSMELARLAQQRGGSEPIRRLGERALQDGGRLVAELERIGAARGWRMPSGLWRVGRAVVDVIGGLNGSAFDVAYSKEAAAGTARLVATFNQMSLTATDAELKARATESLPALREQLQAARALDRNVTLGP